MKKALKALLWLAVAAVVIFLVWRLWFSKRDGAVKGVEFKTESVVIGDISRSISASGTVEPEELVNVGAQVSGKIMSFGVDVDGNTVDYGSRVVAGKPLAQIDDVLYAAELRQRKAERLQAQAAIVTAKATIRQVAAKLQLARLNWERAKELFAKNAMSKSDYDNAESAWISAQADVAAADAQLKQAEAQLAIADAALIKAQRNMDYCVITSPVDGIIIDRRVSVGQTVVSNMSASSIFLIAKEFKKMQVWVSVNEADIGNIRPGQDVEFTVDAFPGELFVGKVKKVRLNATMSQNVVTYIVEVTTDNSRGKLLPYLTANVKFILNKRTNVMNLSNAAFRFRPAPEMVAPEFRNQLSDAPPAGKAVVWIKQENGLLKPVLVELGLNAGSRTEIVSGKLAAGDEVVFAAVEVKSGDRPKNAGQSRSPFMPQPTRRGAPRGAGSAATRARAEQNRAPGK